jgi:hypothetical protein
MDVIVKDLLPGTKYLLQARSKGANGITSQWSNTFKVTTESDTTAPAPITGLSWIVNRTSFVATWTKPTTDSNAKPLKDFNGYEVTVTANSISKKFISMQERFDFSFEQNVASFGAPEPIVEISIKVRDIVGNLSTAASATAANPIPADLTGLTATGIPAAIFLDWDDTVEDDFKQYEIYMSTSGPAFIPGPGNMLATTYSSQFSFPTSDMTTHYFKVRQLDVFNQASDYLAVSGSPLDSTGIDTTPPDAPSNVLVSTVADSAGMSNIAVSWDESTSTNLGGYVVRYSTDEVSWRYISVPADSTDTVIANLAPDVAYYVSVAAVSFVSSYSAWVQADDYPITAAKDSTPPSTPSAPTVSFNTNTVLASHDLTKAGGGDLENDVRYLELHMSETSGFTASAATLIGALTVAGPGITAVQKFPAPVTDVTVDQYWRVVAVDYSGNKSTQSAQVNGKAGLIEGQNIADATIGDAKIGSLSAEKLVAGSAIINDLSIQSKLTLDAASGYIASTNFSIPSKAGWRLDQNGLVIYDGSIAAKSLLLQNGNNITQPPFADFEFNEGYYHDSGNSVVPTTMTATSGMLLAMQYTGVKVGKQALRLWNSTITGSTVHKLHFATGGDSVTGVNIDLNPGDYIFSIWAKKNGAVDQIIKLGLYPDTGSAIESTGIPVTGTSWARYSAVLTVPSGVSRVKQYISLQASTTGYDIIIDAMQLESKLTAETTPSAWKPPSSTIIDGGSVITGSIRSSAASATVIGQPAWSINTAGNMQIGDALVRGKLTMGVPADQKNLVPKMYASFEDAASNYYNTTNNIPNNSNFNVLGTGAGNIRMQQSTVGPPPHGTYGLRTYATSGLAASSFYDIFLGGSNIFLTPGQQYIISAYIRNNDATKTTRAGFGVYNNTDGYTIAFPTAPIATSWTRYSAVFTAPATSVNTFYLALQTQAGETAFDVSWDALQIETAPVGVTTPSAFTDGTIGLSSMASGNYISGQQGWTINSDGTVEFNAATIRGQLIVTGSSGTIKTDLSGFFPTIFFNGNDGSQAYINAAAGGSDKALIGINSASYVQGSNIVRPRVWMPDQIRIEQVDETASVTTGTAQFYGGSILLDKTQSFYSVYDANNIERSVFSMYNDGHSSLVAYDSAHKQLAAINVNDLTSGVRLQSFSGTNIERSAVYLDNNGVIIRNETAAGEILGNIQFTSTDIYIGTANNNFIQYNFAKNALINDTDWSNLTPGSGWVNTGGAYAPAGYRLYPDGTVKMRGAINGGPNGALALILPVGRRPATEVVLPIATGAATAGARIQIQTNGNIYIYSAGAGPVYLEAVSFSLF